MEQLTQEDFLVAMLQKQLRKPYFAEGELKWRNYTFEEWAVRERTKTQMYDHLRKRLFAKG